MNKKLLLYVLLAFVSGMLLMYLFNNYKIEKRNEIATEAGSQKTEVVQSNNQSETKFHTEKPSEGNSIEEFTNEAKVISYVKSNHKLPNYYITKSEAKSKGWNPSKGNLCDVLPGKAIGGDKFSNREKQLPQGEQYYEADVNYNCGNRGAYRIVFTKNGEVWLTKNHYKSFEKQ